MSITNDRDDPEILAHQDGDTFRLNEDGVWGAWLACHPENAVDLEEME